jgi:hypothetical protein
MFVPVVPTSLLTQQLAGTDMKALAIAVNSNVAQGVKPEEVRPLTMDERVVEWPQLFTTWKHFPGTLPMTDDGEPSVSGLKKYLVVCADVAFGRRRSCLPLGVQYCLQPLMFKTTFRASCLLRRPSLRLQTANTTILNRQRLL